MSKASKGTWLAALAVFITLAVYPLCTQTLAAEYVQENVEMDIGGVSCMVDFLVGGTASIWDVFDPDEPTALVIPETLYYEGKPYTVTRLGLSIDWSGGCTNITALTLPESITELDGSMNHFSAIKELVVPGGVEVVEVSLQGCKGLERLVFSEGVKEISSGSMVSGCSKLTEIVLPDSLERITGTGTFSGASALAHIELPEGVVITENSTFSDCTSLTSVTLPASVTEITSSMFSGCTSLESVTAEGAITKVGNSAFSECSALTSVTGLESVTSIGQYAFYQCRNLSGSMDLSQVTEVGAYAFNECFNLSGTLDLTNLTSVETYAFAYYGYNAGGVDELILGSGLESIYSCAFCFTTIKNNVALPEGLEELGNGAFYYAQLGSGKLSLPDSVASLGGWAFQGSNIGELYIGSGLDSIPSDAFDGCPLTKVTINASSDDIDVPDGTFPEGAEVEYTVQSIGDVGETISEGGVGIHDAAAAGGTVKLEKDVKLESTLTIPAGKAVTLTSDRSFTLISDKAKDLDSLIVVEEGASLTLEGDLTLSARYVSGSAIVCHGSLEVRGNVVIKNAVLDAMSTAVIDASGENAEVVISGGSVEDNKLSEDYSAPVMVSDGAELRMTGGSIRNNSLTGRISTSSAGVLVREGGTFTMSGGSICGNSGVRGSGVMVYNRDDETETARFTMTGGKISGNTSSGGSGTSRASGAVHVEGYALFELRESGEISLNSAPGGAGGGVCVVDPDIQSGRAGCGTAFIMTGGKISGNSAQTGGGVYSYTDGVDLQAGEITDNTAYDLGGGVYSEGNADYYSTLNMQNALITGNTATEQGGGLWFCATGETTVHEAEGAGIFGNTADKAGDDFAFTQSDGAHTATLAGNTLGGGSVGWYRDGSIYLPVGGSFYPSVDESVPRYGEDGADTSPVEVSDSSSGLALKAVVSGTAQAYAREQARLIITGNTASYGGGVGANGGVTIGTDGGTKSLSVEKLWEGDDPNLRPDAVEIVLSCGDDEIDRVRLSAGADGSWTHSFTGLDENAAYTVSESPVAGYTSSTKVSDDGSAVTITNTYEPGAAVIQLAGVTIYVGGEQGYDGVVDGDDVVSSNSLPVPGFLVTLPEALSGVPLDQLSLVYEHGDTLYNWKLTKYGPGEHNVCRIDPVEGTGGVPVRMSFTNAAGEIVQDDEFDLDEHINQDLSMKVYGEGIDEKYITLRYGEAKFPIEVGEDATLRVRGAHDDTEYGETVLPGETVPSGRPGVAVPQDAVYTINESAVQVADPSGVALLFDDIIETNAAGGVSNTALLVQRAEEELGASAGRYELKYLDLVDRGNGNVWVTASEPVTVYWPLPEGTDAGTEFVLLHFKGLDREMNVGDVAQDIRDCEVSNVQLVNDGEHVSFTVGPGGFSPFILCWDLREEPDLPPIVVPGGPSEPAQPEYKPNWLNTDDHYAYIIGYEDGTVRPEAGITRAEVATIFFRLLTDEAREEFWCETNAYTDVAPGAWYNNAVSTLSSMGILGGYEDGSFRPNSSITRAEFAKIAVSFFEYKDLNAENIFTDVAAGSWYASFVAAAAKLGLIEGCAGNVYRPDANITRAEACTIINRTLGRAPDADHLLPEAVMNTWPDNRPGAWYYAQVQEATNSHDYNWYGDIEQWTEKLPERDWDALED